MTNVTNPLTVLSVRFENNRFVFNIFVTGSEVKAKVKVTFENASGVQTNRQTVVLYTGYANSLTEANDEAMRLIGEHSIDQLVVDDALVDRFMNPIPSRPAFHLPGDQIKNMVGG